MIRRLIRVLWVCLLVAGGFGIARGASAAPAQLLRAFRCGLLSVMPRHECDYEQVVQAIRLMHQGFVKLPGTELRSLIMWRQWQPVRAALLPPPGLPGVPGGAGVLAELMQQALLAGLRLQVVMPLAGELAADAGR